MFKSFISERLNITFNYEFDLFKKNQSEVLNLLQKIGKEQQMKVFLEQSSLFDKEITEYHRLIPADRPDLFEQELRFIGGVNNLICELAKSIRVQKQFETQSIDSSNKAVDILMNNFFYKLEYETNGIQEKSSKLRLLEKIYSKKHSPLIVAQDAFIKIQNEIKSLLENNGYNDEATRFNDAAIDLLQSIISRENKNNKIKSSEGLVDLIYKLQNTHKILKERMTETINRDFLADELKAKGDSIEQELRKMQINDDIDNAIKNIENTRPRNKGVLIA